MKKGIRLGLVFCGCGLGLALPVFSQITVEMIKDIKVNQDEWGIGCFGDPLATPNPGNVASMNGILYFVGQDDLHGGELWRSDGTPQGTYMVKDITVGTAPMTLFLTNVNGTLFFNATDRLADPAGYGSELWKSDGTEAGTKMVKDIWIGQNGSIPTQLTNVNGKLFFLATDGNDPSNPNQHGLELWVSDGTEAGTHIVKDILEGRLDTGEPWGSVPQFLTPVNDVLYFTASPHETDYELWRSDGTAGGTFMVKDIAPYYSDQAPWFLTKVGSRLFFTTWDTLTENNSHGRELWVSDGSVGGTYLVKDIFNGQDPLDPSPTYLTDVNGICYFVDSNGSNGRELWRSDGTSDGTYMLKDIYPGNDLENDPVPFNIIDVGGRLFFSAHDGIHGRELWTEKRDSSPVNDWTVF